MAQHEPARYDSESLTFMPPSRAVGFNCCLVHDDGLLIGSVARREGVSYEVAHTIVANEVGMLKRRLSSSGMALIPGIGTLMKQGGSIVFEPETERCVARWRYAGLQPLTLGAVSAADAVEADKPQLLQVEFRSPSRLRWLRVAASVALLVGLGAVLSTPISVNQDSLQYASISTPTVSAPHAVELPAPADTLRKLYCIVPDSSVGKATVMSVKARTKKLTPAVKTLMNRAAIAKHPEVEAGHYLIVASCETRRKAERYVKRRSSQGLAIVEGDGRFRIYVAASDSKAELEEMRSGEVGARYPDAWIYSRR